MEGILKWAEGKKTYGFLILWTLYKLAVSNNWILPHPDWETFLYGGIGLSVRSAISKLKAS